jgi:hypothetical protein
MNQISKNILDRVDAWPQEDQQELLDMVRAIEARRAGIYVLDEDEQAAIGAARRSNLADEDKVLAFWKRFGIA